MAINTQGKSPKRSRSDDSWPPPSSSSSSLYGPPPKTEEEYLEFCLILLAHCGAAAAEKEGTVVRSSTEKEPELPSSFAAKPLTVVAPEIPSAPVDAKPLAMYLAGKYYKCHRNNNADDGKDHECGICHRVFSSGQALGGHKRRHSEGKIGTCNRCDQGVEKAESTSEGGCRSRSEGSTQSAVSGTGQSSSSKKGGVNLFDLNMLPLETTAEEDNLLCWETTEEVLSPVLPPPAKRP